MAEAQRDARALIEELRTELAATDVADQSKRDRLDRLIESLDERLAGELEEPHQELVGELRDEAMEFAVEHPDVAATLRGFMRMLSSIGI